MKIKIVAVFIMFLGYTVNANAANNSMSKVFDTINAQGNITTPTAIQSQTMNYMTGGSVFMRTPSNTYNLVTITPPSASASCGGIDLYMGGFSYINKQMFVSMMKNIGSAALGYGFKLALQNLCPTCDNVLQSLQAITQQINRMNIDSCEAAKGIINASTASMNLKGREQSSMNMGTMKNMFSDMTEAWQKNKGNDANTSNTLESVTQSDPTLKDHIAEGNITWKALSKIGALTDEEKYLIMGMVGTVIFSTENGKPKPIAYPRRITNIGALIGSDVAAQRTFPVYRCISGTLNDGCNKVELYEMDIPDNFYALVNKKMNVLIDAIRNRQPLNNSQDIIQFINLVDIPVYKLIALNTQYGAPSDAAQQALGMYKELIAAKYALAYFDKVAKETDAALVAYEVGTEDAATAIEVKKIRENLQATRNDLYNSSQIAYSRSSVSWEIFQTVQHMERTLQSNMSPVLRNSIVFGNSLVK